MTPNCAGLEALKAQGEANGVEGLEIVDAGGIRRREPHAAGVAALLSPNTGVVEPEALVHALARSLEEAGGYLLTGTRLAGAAPHQRRDAAQDGARVDSARAWW